MPRSVALAETPLTIDDLPYGWRPEMDTFGNRLRVMRHHLGYTVDEIADLCDIAHATWSSWETRGAQPRDLVNTVRSIADATRVDPFWLMFGNDVPKGQNLKMLNGVRLDRGQMVLFEGIEVTPEGALTLV